MKKVKIILIWMLLAYSNVFSQSPKSFKYQAVVRDGTGAVITTHNVSLQINIVQDTSVGGTIVYSETYTNITPNKIGMVNLDIGKGTIFTGSFNNIDWGKHKFYIEINMDPNGGSNYLAMGISELLSVPYALYAATAGNSGSSNLNLTGTGSTTVTGTYPNYTINGNYQSLKGSNDTIYLSNGGYVKLPYTAGTGIGFTGTHIINTMPNETHTGDAIGSGALRVVAIQGNSISTILPSNGQSLVWNGSAWCPSTISSNTYNAGTGLTLSGNTFLNSGVISVVAGTGISVYSALGSASINNTLPNVSHTGDALGSGALTVVAIQGNSISTILPTNGQSLVWNGSAWTPTANAGQAYYAGTGLSINGTTFYHLAHTGDAIGQTNLTVVALQGKAISTMVPTTNQVLNWNGTAWTPVNGGVSGSGKSNLVAFWTSSSAIGSSSDTGLYWDNTNQRLGIGTSKPGQQLDINGNINIPNSALTTYSTTGFINKGANTFIHNYGTNNFFAGISAGNNTLTGTDNAGVGFQVLMNDKTGFYNSALGSGALYTNTSGAGNIAIGYYSLYNNINGTDNIGIGYMPLVSNTAGRNNIAIGDNALNSNTSAWLNIALGHYALYANTTGQYNISIGSSSTAANITGQFNTALGTSALTSSTGVGYNTAIGTNALYSNTSGAYNTGLGYYADVSPANLSNATTIGYGAIVNATNKVRIGNTAVTVIEGQVAWSYTSDMRFKQNIKDIGVGMDFIMKLKPVEYEVKTGDTRLNYGFIAQDLLQLVGENNTLVNIGGDDNKTLSVRITDLIAPMVKGMQEQQAIIQQQQVFIQQQQTINKDQQQQIDKLKEEIQQLKKK